MTADVPARPTLTRGSVGAPRPARRHLPGIVAGLIALAAGAGVGVLADAAGEHDGPSRLDPLIAADVLGLRTPALTEVAHAFTFVGSEVVVGGIALVLMVGLLLRGRSSQAAYVAVGMAGSATLTVAVKLCVARPRPGTLDRLGALDPSYSFPSGHTLNSIVLLALVVAVLWRTARVGARVALVAVASLAAVGVGLSRIYLGYHWFTDVVASGLVAAAWLGVVWCLHRPLAASAERLASRLSGRRT